MKHHLIHGALVGATVLYSGLRFRGSLLEHAPEEITPVFWVACVVVIFHTIRAGIRLTGTLHREAMPAQMETEGSIHLPSGQKNKIPSVSQPNPVPYYFAKIWVTVSLVVSVLICAFVLSLPANPKAPDEATYIPPTNPFVVRMSSLITNGAIALWALDDRVSNRGYFCKPPIWAEMYLTNNQSRSTIVTDIHTEAQDVHGNWNSLGVIDTALVRPAYQGLNMRHLSAIVPIDGKYFDQMVAGKNLGPGETASGWLLISQAPTEDIRGPFIFKIYDTNGGPYTIGPISVSTDNTGLPEGGFLTLPGFIDMSNLKQEECPLMWWKSNH